MTVPIETEGRITNSKHASHRVLVKDDSENSGGFLIFEWWEGADGPNDNSAFDSWVASAVELEEFFRESEWQVEWLSNIPVNTDASCPLP